MKFIIKLLVTGIVLASFISGERMVQNERATIQAKNTVLIMEDKKPEVVNLIGLSVAEFLIVFGLCFSMYVVWYENDENKN